MQDYLVILHTILGVDVFASIRDIGEPAVAGSLDQHIVAKASKQVFGLIHDSSGRGLIRKLLCVIRYIVIIENYRLRSTEILDKSKRKWIPYRKKLFVIKDLKKKEAVCFGFDVLQIILLKTVYHLLLHSLAKRLFQGCVIHVCCARHIIYAS